MYYNKICEVYGLRLCPIAITNLLTVKQISLETDRSLKLINI